ncbi:hypothetical protein RO3G_09332 [Rhizopus delemar RA 99-880]|uniref:HTH CENPB-type domain-containing protein n=1 Tax=Rhizopus delemar (strain RA 99-880 / ATCC MYA-4621 / FGSC 9543 / NRRL 43880) TaxID=246409 RepID=I1C842_RHIO9|nr:hypothetical protein RO3G_09332 [Rhizopus delemar RA 99-880]|eukprot:EIE84622.1 hypothetical protein RO3G_09332 [Rhizopus delemar RA 99-880]
MSNNKRVRLSVSQKIELLDQNAETLYSNINVVKNGKSLKPTRYPQLDEVYRIPENEISFSSGWLTKLFKRIGVKCRPMHGESALVDITSENVQNELRKIEEILEPYDPVDIMNHMFLRVA